MKYLVMFEHGETGFSAYVPDLPGCVAAAESLEETRTLIGEAIAMHISAMREEGEPIPEPSVSELVDVAV